MSIDDKKPWERPWTTQEMIENASNWNLAGDAGLLKYLEEFSDRMLSKVKDTNERLNDLIDSAEETSLALNNATNRFMGLRNTQFIESRVYDDDETLPVKNTETTEEKPKATEAERLADMKQAIINGLDIIDKYYEKVEIPESDSESENDSSEANIVYKPVDPYCDRPLPYVIGTAEWHKYWHVGLGHSSSDSEIENEEEQFSESESEQDVQVKPNRERTRISESESEDYSKNKMSRPVANSTFNDQTTKNMFDSSSDSETGSLPPQVNTVNSNFAEELAAKLGKVESSSSNIQVEVNTKPIKKPSASNIPGGLFSDEPPPLENDDIFVPKNITSDLFSGGNGLFDDDDDNDTDFWNTKPTSDNVKKPLESKDLFAEDQDQNDIFNSKTNISESKPEKPIKKSLGLFDDDDDDDQDVNNIFNTSSITQNKKSLFPTLDKTTAPIISEEPPELTSKPSESKKPVGGVSILGPNVLLDSKIFQKRAASSSSDSDNDNDSNKDFDKVEPPKTKVPSLFDDSSPLFTDDIFANSSIKKFSSKLFEAEEPPPLEKASESESNKESSIFDDNDELFSAKKDDASKKIPSPSLFDHSDEDLFSSITNTNTNKRGEGHSHSHSHSLFDPNPPSLISENKSKSVNLFDPNPPELDEWDGDEPSSYNSNNNSNSNSNAGRAFLYDTEPPMLSNESSGIVRDQSTRLESEDSSFNPYLTSSRRHSDLFHDTQTADSLLTTRNKVDLTTEKSTLSGIPEIDSITNIDITASGNESSLVANADSSVFTANISSQVQVQVTEKPSIAKKPTLTENTDTKSNVLNEEKIVKPSMKGKNVFGDSDSDSEDLFANNSSATTTKKNKNIFESDLFADSKVDLFQKDNNQNEDKGLLHLNVDTKNKENDSKKFNYEQNLKSDEDIKVDPKKSLSFEKNIETEKTASKEETDGTSPGKLKHNLNINLQALLPGASPPKKNLEKSVSLDSSESQNQSSTPTEELIAKPVIKSAEPRPTLEKSISFESPVEHNEILPSAAVKERAKIPVKRRPSTRRARQEAIRKSVADLRLEDAIFENLDAPQTKSENILNIANIDHGQTEKKPQNIKIEADTEDKTNPLSPSTDEEDFPTMPIEKDLSDHFTDNSLFGQAPIISPIEEPKTIKKEEKQDIFDAIKKPPKNLDLFSTSKTDLFSNITSLPSQSQSSKASIFSSSDSENDLFSPPKTEMKKEKKENNNVVLSSPDDDLFKPSSKVSYDDLFKSDDIFSKKKPSMKPITTKKSSLFDDDDDDDIFGSSSSSSLALPKPVNTPSSSTTTIKKPIINKLKKMPVDSVEDLLDPLEALKK